MNEETKRAITKYVLNSGGLRNNPAKAKEFFAEVLKGLGEKPKVLMCFFAAPREDWESKFLEYSKRFGKLAPEGVSPVFALAFPDQFVEQIASSDVIILHGGDDHLLKYWLKQFKVPSIWNGKVVAGSSAGSDVLCTHYWTCDWRTCMDGLGILPIKFIPHFKSEYGATDPRGPIDWDKAYQELIQYGNANLPMHALLEGHYVIIEQ